MTKERRFLPETFVNSVHTPPAAQSPRYQDKGNKRKRSESTRASWTETALQCQGRLLPRKPGAHTPLERSNLDQLGRDVKMPEDDDSREF